MIVVDASAIVGMLIQAPTAAALAADTFNANREVHAPHLIDIEVMHVFRRLLWRSEISLERAAEAIVLFRLLPIHRHAHEALLSRIWEYRANLTAYDAAYVALAELLATVVVTTDARLAAAPGMTRWIKLVT